MEGELVGSPSDTGESQSPPSCYSKIFQEQLPNYLAMGMTPGQFWDEDCTLAKAYREAYEIRREAENQKLWLQGLYIYEALLCVSPMFHDFVKRPKPLPYSKEPYPLTDKARDAIAKREEAKKFEETKAHLQAWVKRVNTKHAEKNG